MRIFLRNHTGTVSSFYKLRLSVFPSKYITVKLCRHDCQVQCSAEPQDKIAHFHSYWILFFDLITSIELFRLRACSHRSGYLQSFLILISSKKWFWCYIFCQTTSWRPWADFKSHIQFDTWLYLSNVMSHRHPENSKRKGVPLKIHVSD